MAQFSESQGPRCSLSLFRYEVDDLRLKPVGVLAFVNQQRTDSGLNFGASRQGISEQVTGRQHQLRKINCLAPRQLRSIAALQFHQQLAKAALQWRDDASTVVIEQGDATGAIGNRPAF